MKKYFAGIFFSLITICFLRAQEVNEYGAKAIVIEDIRKMMSKGEQPCIKTDIPEAAKKDVEKAWGKIARKETKAKVELLNNEFSIAGTTLKQISAKPLNVYAIMNQYPQHIELNVFFEEDNKFLSKENAETAYLAARMFVREFAVSQYRNAVMREIKNEEDKATKMEKGVSKLHKGNDKLHKSINSAKRKIENEGRTIKTSEQDQQRVRNQIQSLKADLLKLKSSGASEVVVKDAEKKLKTAEKELANMEKQEDKMHKAVEKEEANIRGFERNINDNEQSTLLQRNEITAQRELIYKLKKKLEGIK